MHKSLVHLPRPSVCILKDGFSVYAHRHILTEFAMSPLVSDLGDQEHPKPKLYYCEVCSKSTAPTTVSTRVVFV